MHSFLLFVQGILVENSLEGGPDPRKRPFFTLFSDNFFCTHTLCWKKVVLLCFLKSSFFIQLRGVCDLLKKARNLFSS